MYELRNTLFYQMSAARAALLESELVPEKPDPKNPKLRVGMFTERESVSESPQKLLGIFPIAHGVGLALIYGASLGGWVYIFVNFLFSKSEIYVSLIIAVIVSGFTAILFGITAYKAHKRAQMAHPPVTHV
jgi:type IV secretory pathway VirB6-like protein